MSWPTVSDDPRIQAAYERMRSDGESHNTADMLAHRLPPGLKGTDRALLQGNVNYNQFADCPLYGKKVMERAKAAGVNTSGKVYMPALADSVGDPKAWIGSVSDAKSLLRERNWNSEGVVEHKADSRLQDAVFRKAESSMRMKLNPQMVDEEVDRRVAAEPELAHHRPELTESVRKEMLGVYADDAVAPSDDE